MALMLAALLGTAAPAAAFSSVDEAARIAAAGVHDVVLAERLGGASLDTADGRSDEPSGGGSDDEAGQLSFPSSGTLPHGLGIRLGPIGSAGHPDSGAGAYHARAPPTA